MPTYSEHLARWTSFWTWCFVQVAEWERDRRMRAVYGPCADCEGMGV